MTRLPLRCVCASTSALLLLAPTTAMPEAQAIHTGSSDKPAASTKLLTEEEVEYLTGSLPASTFPAERLGSQEMASASGRFGPVGAAVGAITGAAGYFGEAIVSGNGSASGLIIATTVGAAAGFLTGGTSSFGASAIAFGSIAFYGGLATGMLNRGCSSCHAAYPVKTNWNVAPLVDSPPLFQKTVVFRPGEIRP